MQSKTKARVRVFAPATIANLGPGFDVFGIALKGMGDTVEVERLPSGIKVEVRGPYAKNVPADENNCAVVAAKAMLSRLKLDSGSFGFRMRIRKGVPLSCGLGGSGASSAAGAYAMALLASRQAKKKVRMEEVILAAGEGERSVSGAFHLDNVAPSAMGGFVVISEKTFVRFSPPENMFISVVRPLTGFVEGKTKKARWILPARVELKKVVEQLGHASILLSGFAREEVKLIGEGVNDVIVEPARASLIPGFYDVKKEAIAAGAYGASIAGAGPSVFAVCGSRKKAGEIAKRMSRAFESAGAKSESFVFRPDELGVRKV